MGKIGECFDEIEEYGLAEVLYEVAGEDLEVCAFCEDLVGEGGGEELLD